MNNQDKAKKILFGNKNIGADPLWDTDQAKAYENITRKLNEAGVPVTNPDERKKFNEFNIWYKFSDDAHSEEDAVMAIMGALSGLDENVAIGMSPAYPSPIEAYCKEQGMTPAELLNNYCKYVKQSELDKETMALIHEAAVFVKNGSSNLVLTYCKEAGITPEQLIEDHKKMSNSNYEDFQ